MSLCKDKNFSKKEEHLVKPLHASNQSKAAELYAMLHHNEPSIQNSEERYQTKNYDYERYQRLICFHHHFPFLNWYIHQVHSS